MTQRPSHLRPQRHRWRTAAGFTLVEVLAALMLVGIVLPIAMQGVTLSLQTAARSRHLTEASQLGNNKLNELAVLKDESLFNGSGQFEGFPEYRWESTSTLRDTGLYEVNVRVIWTAQGLEQWLTLTTLIAPASTTGVTSTTGTQ
jgi:prepilin-type N-terminal cleavage/methylation domain-containing protein